MIIDLRDQIRAILEDPDIDELDQAVEALHSVMKATLDRLNGDVARYRDALGLAKANSTPGSSHRLRDKLRQAEATIARVQDLAEQWAETIAAGTMAGSEWEQCLRGNLPMLRAALGQPEESDDPA